MTARETHLPCAQVQQQGAEEAPVLAAQEPHHGVAAPATGLYALVRRRRACSVMFGHQRRQGFARAAQRRRSALICCSLSDALHRRC